MEYIDFTIALSVMDTYTIEDSQNVIHDMLM